MAESPIQTSRNHHVHRYYRLLVAVLGFSALFLITSQTPLGALHLWTILYLAVVTAVLVSYPVNVFSLPVSIFPMITLGAGLLYGPATACWGAALGIGAGWLFRAQRRSVFGPKSPPAWDELAFQQGWHHLALILALLAGGRQPGAADIFALPGSSGAVSFTPVQGTPAIPGAWLGLFYSCLLFPPLHAALLLGDFCLDDDFSLAALTKDLRVLAIVELLPIPLVLLSVLSYPAIGTGVLFLLSLVSLTVAVLAHRLAADRADLKRHLHELATLNQVSQVLRSNLDLDSLLSVIHDQVSEILKVDNFYVALSAPDGEFIWYPLAIKQGRRENWAPRPLSDRLTDRVIRERRPVLFAQEDSQSPNFIPLQPSAATPTSWMGVPLVSSERMVGCLAIFSSSPLVRFKQADLNLLSLFSGQISVAIENALLFEQTQQRAARLETLNRLSTLITASLNPQEVFQQVCSSAATVVGARWSAIYLLDTDNNRVWLAHAHRLSQEFVLRSQSYLLSQGRRTLCLRSGQPVLFPNLEEQGLETGLAETLKAEGILAYGDFPLSTPDGQIGMLTVFSDGPHKFEAEEVNLLMTFAAQAALAVSNARLHASTDQALAQRAQQLSTLEAVGRELSAATHSNHLFEMILEHALQYTGSPWGCIGLYDPESCILEVKAQKGYPGLALAMATDASVLGRAVRHQQVINIVDVRAEPGYVDLTGGEARSQLCVPLLHEGQVLGVLMIENPQLNGYTSSDQAFVSQLANQAAIAVVNAQLYTDVIQGRDRLATVLNSVGEAIIMLDAGGRILIANDACRAVAGLQPAELVGGQLSGLPGPALRALGYSPAEAARLLEALGQGRVITEPRLVFKLGEHEKERILERVSSPVWGYGRVAGGWMIALRDITEEYRLSQTREMITETLVHDLRSPLSAVIGALNVLEDELSREPGTGKISPQALEIARRGTNRVLGLVESLLDISRMQSGAIELVQTPVDLYDFIEGILPDYILQASEYEVLLQNRVTQSLPKVFIDPGKIARVVMNLLDNALKFTPSGGMVVVSADPFPADAVAVKISDTGPGIPPEYREKIFERFIQVPGQGGRRRGSGLGLTFCHMAIEAHGGRIWVEANPGGGSQFIFTLPVYQPA